MSTVVTPTNLGPEFQLGTVTASKITIAVDGTSVERDAVTGVLSAAPPTYDNATKILTFPAQDGNAPLTVDLSTLTTDVFVDGGSFDAATATLTLTDTSGTTPNVVVDLSTLLGVSADAGNILTDGSDGKPFFDPSTLAACQDAFGVDILRAFPV